MATSRSDDDDAGVAMYSPEDLALLERVSRSKLWQLLCDALAFRREQLFSQSITRTEDLWRNRGALEEVQTLLHKGPTFVLLWQRHMRAEAHAKSESPVASPITRDDDPDFDL